MIDLMLYVDTFIIKLEKAGGSHSEDVQGGHHGVLDPGREAQVG